MQPGWYPDPFTPSELRWWDGTQWTQWTNSASLATTHSTSPNRLGNPRNDLAAEELAGRRARIALTASAAIAIAISLIYAVVMHQWLHDVVHEFRVAANNPQDTAPRIDLQLGRVLPLEALGLLQLAPQIILIIWLYRSATFAARAGLAARHEPAWAWAGFLVPVVNLWFPLQVAQDTVPPGHPARALALRWWLSWIAQGLTATVIAAVSYFSVAAAVGAALVFGVVPVLAAYYGRAMIAAVLNMHREVAAHTV